MEKQGTPAQKAAGIQLVEKCLRLAPDTRDSATLELYGQLLLEFGRYREATEVFERVLRLRSGHCRARVGLAWALYYQGNKRAALEQLQQAKRIAKTNPDCSENHAVRNLGRYYFLERSYDLAYSCFQAAIDKDVTDSESYLEIGRFLLARAQYEKAMAAFEKVRELLPSNAAPVVLAELDELILAASTGMAKG